MSDIEYTPAELATLNEARTLLKELGDRHHYDTRVAAAADIAENAIFMFLNYAGTYGDVAISEDALHNRVVTVSR